MELSIQNILKNRIEAYKNNSLEKQFELEKADYQRNWARAVQFFQKRVNKDRKKEKQPELSFIAIRQKLVALKEIDDLRWFYLQCLEYIPKKKGNTFSKCFFGSLKIK